MEGVDGSWGETVVPVYCWKLCIRYYYLSLEDILQLGNWRHCQTNPTCCHTFCPDLGVNIWTLFVVRFGRVTHDHQTRSPNTYGFSFKRARSIHHLYYLDVIWVIQARFGPFWWWQTSKIALSLKDLVISPYTVGLVLLLYWFESSRDLSCLIWE